jgi:hypothetical protein
LTALAYILLSGQPAVSGADFKYKFGGREKLLSVGIYPEAPIHRGLAQ